MDATLDPDRGTPGRRRLTAAATAAATWLAATALHAHTDPAEAAGFAAGFMHPLGGADHMLAMFAVGIWGAVLGAPAIWGLPVMFPLVMTVGGLLGIFGVPLPLVEPGIIASVIALGLFVLWGRTWSLGVPMLWVGVFAIFHGYAHGAEMGSGDAAGYSAGFVLATGLVHLAGIAFGLLDNVRYGRRIIRAAGFAIAVCGAAMAAGWW